MDVTEIDHNLSIGSQPEEPEKLAGMGYDAVLNVASEIKYPHPEGILYRHVSLTDDGENNCDDIDRAVAELEKMIASGKRVFLHCRSGKSRSPSIAALYYSRNKGHTLASAIDAIKSKRNIVSPHPEFFAVASMCEVMRKLPVV